MILLAASLLALLIFGARIGRTGATAGESRATTALRGALAAFALLVSVQAGLGALGLLTAAATAIALAIAAMILVAAARLWPQGRRQAAARVPSTAREAALEAGFLTALLTALWLRFRTGAGKPSFLYDTLSYHLHAPVSWMHAHRLTIVPAVFGDPAPAYAPGNMELWFLFLLAPLRSDYLAGVGQLAAAALAATAIVAGVREGGGNRSAALGAALAFLLVPEVWNQIPTAMVDLGLAALLLASLPFALRGELVAVAAALGLAIGTKYVGLVLALPFAALAGAIAVRTPGAITARRLLAAAAVGLATGGFWYLRNAAVTGNPLYPGAFPGLSLPALYDAAAMRAWDYHIPLGDVSMLFAMFVDASLGFAAAGAVALVRTWRVSTRARGLPLVALALVLLFWCVIPYQESRFLFATYGVMAIAVGQVAHRPPARLGWGALVAAILGPLIGLATRTRLALLPAAAVGACLAPLRKRAPGWLRGSLVAGAVSTLLVAGALGFRDYLARDPGYAMGVELADAWSWFRANVKGARVAYTGNNLAFPLAGERLGNRVAYVNVAGDAGDRLHDFARRSGAAPTANAEPAPYRDGADFDVWWRNLRAGDTQVLFVATLEPIVRRNVAADDDGFPIERAWADAHPDRFGLRYASPAARVYALLPTAPP